MTLDLIIVIALLVLGVLFMLIEIFLLPGISIAGIAGAIFLIGGIAYAYLFLGSTAGNVSLIASGATLGGVFVWLLRSKSLRKISLNTNIESTVDNTNLQKMDCRNYRHRSFPVKSHRKGDGERNCCGR